MAALSHLGSKREALFPWISGQDAGLIATASGKRRLLADEGDVLWRGQAGTGGRLIFGIASFMLSAAHDRLDRRARVGKRVAIGELLAPIRLGPADWLLNLNRAFLLNEPGGRSF